MCKALYFSRGRGRGHAIPDLCLAQELLKLRPDIDVQFVSYAVGAETLREHGWSVIDLELAETTSFLSVLLYAQALIRYWQPHVVIIHEEFAVPIAACIAGVPNIVITDWFPAPSSIEAEAFAAAQSIIFLGEPGVFALPPVLNTKPLFVPPVIRRMRYALADRARARLELQVPHHAFVVSVVPGAWATESRMPIASLVATAFAKLNATTKQLLWISKDETGAIAESLASLSEARLIADCETVERIFAASDLVLTKGNRGTIQEVARLGIPSISLSSGKNPIDDILIASIGSNKSLNLSALDPDTLAWHMDKWGRRERPLSGADVPLVETDVMTIRTLEAEIARVAASVRLSG